MDLKDLYREVILDHNKNPRNYGRLDPADGHAAGHNPLCGDRLNITVRVAGDKLEDVQFEGHGCAISVASASLMTEAVRGKTREEFAKLYGEVHDLLTHPGATPSEELGKLAALGGVNEFPARVKCASLCWHTLDAALKDSGATSVTTE
jgi:nitrogen fixation NifU-like protein